MVEKADVSWVRFHELARGVLSGQLAAEDLAKESTNWPDADEIAALATEAATVLDRLDDAMIKYLEE
jgi:hypothetical protein